MFSTARRQETGTPSAAIQRSLIFFKMSATSGRCDPATGNEDEHVLATQYSEAAGEECDASERRLWVR